MKIVKLNCTSCGAPISIPENIDTLFCSSCGSKLAVDRGEGYVTLQLVEKLTQAVQESGEKAHSAIKENTYVTKTELKRVQISQSINTEEMKLNTLRQEMRSLTRKPQLLPVELQQLNSLWLDECNILLKIRKYNLDSAKLEEGWEESMDVFQADLVALNEIIQTLQPNANYVLINQRMQELLQERARCERHLEELETELLSRQLKWLSYKPLAELTLEEVEKLRGDVQVDMKLLTGNPQSVVKTRLLTELNTVIARINAIYPRMKVESVTGPLKSLDLQPPYPEIPWELIPLIELADGDLVKVNQSPENPCKALIKQQIERISQELKTRQAMDLPGQRVLAEKRRKKRQKVTWIVILSVVGAIIFFIFVAALVNHSTKHDSPVSETRNNNPNPTSTSKTVSQYQKLDIKLLEIVAQKTYLRAEASPTSQESTQLVYGDLVYNLGQAGSAQDWYNVITTKDAYSGYLYQEWVSPIYGTTIKASPFPQPGHLLFSEDFSNNNKGWYEDTFSAESENYTLQVRNGHYQIDTSATTPYFVNSYIPMDELPSSYIVSATTENLSSDGLSSAGLIFNYIDQDNFDYFLLTSDGEVLIGMRRNGLTVPIYDSSESKGNQIPSIVGNGANELSLLVEVDEQEGSSSLTFGLNGFEIYNLVLEKAKTYTSNLGVMVYTLDHRCSAAYSFDNFKVYEN